MAISILKPYLWQLWLHISYKNLQKSCVCVKKKIWVLWVNHAEFLTISPNHVMLNKTFVFVFFNQAKGRSQSKERKVRVFFNMSSFWVIFGDRMTCIMGHISKTITLQFLLFIWDIVWLAVNHLLLVWTVIGNEWLFIWAQICSD